MYSLLRDPHCGNFKGIRKKFFQTLTQVPQMKVCVKVLTRGVIMADRGED